jgi:polyferredoxin
LEASSNSRRKLTRTVILTLFFGPLAVVALFVLNSAASSGSTNAWPVYFFAAAVGAFLWTVIGIFVRGK